MPWTKREVGGSLKAAKSQIAHQKKAISFQVDLFCIGVQKTGAIHQSTETVIHRNQQRNKFFYIRSAIHIVVWTKDWESYW